GHFLGGKHTRAGGARLTTLERVEVARPQTKKIGVPRPRGTPLTGKTRRRRPADEEVDDHHPAGRRLRQRPALDQLDERHTRQLERDLQRRGPHGRDLPGNWNLLLLVEGWSHGHLPFSPKGETRTRFRAICRKAHEIGACTAISWRVPIPPTSDVGRSA